MLVGSSWDGHAFIRKVTQKPLKLNSWVSMEKGIIAGMLSCFRKRLVIEVVVVHASQRLDLDLLTHVLLLRFLQMSYPLPYFRESPDMSYF